MFDLSELSPEELVLLIAKANRFCTRKPSSSGRNWNARNVTNAALHRWLKMA